MTKQTNMHGTYEEHLDLDYYINESHWNSDVNRLLLKNLKVYYSGTSLGEFLYSSWNTPVSPITDYAGLYGDIFNEAYRICNKILHDPNPETKITSYLREAATRKWRLDNLDLEPNAFDIIEAYHILCISFAILCYQTKKTGGVRRAIDQICVENHSVYFMLETHEVRRYCLTYQLFVYLSLHYEMGLRYNYPYKKVNDSMTKSFVWYANLSNSHKDYGQNYNTKDCTDNERLQKEIVDKCLSTIYRYYKQIEKLPSNYVGKKEPSLRDLIIPTLNSGVIPNISTTGESVNNLGKTDICIKSFDGENLLIAECKIWDGELMFLSAIDQLFNRYITWGDKYACLIIFVKNKGFSSVINMVRKTVRKHDYYKCFMGSDHENTLSYKFRHSKDREREIRLEIMLFHFVENVVDVVKLH